MRHAICVHHVLASGKIRIDKLFSHGQPSIINEDIHSLSHCVLLYLLQALLRLTQIHLHNHHATRVFAFGFDSFQLFHGSRRYYHVLSPQFHKSLCQLFSYAAASPCYEDCLALEVWLTLGPLEVIIELVKPEEA